MTMKNPSPWNVKSGICPCWQCEGTGGEMSKPYAQNGDPDNYMIDCDVCEGSGHTPCEVCGFDIAIPGYDCLACQMVYDIPDELITDAVANALTAAVKAAMRTRWQQRSGLQSRQQV